MNPNPHWQRALLLFNQSRWDLAEEECRRAIGEDPGDSRLHALLARCLSERKEYAEATDAAQHAIHLATDDAFAHASLAQVLVDRKRYQEAEQAIREAIALNPHESNYYAVLASIHFSLRRWQPALEAAEQGLACDPEDSGCVNLRAMALVKLGRADAAGAAIDTALRLNPEDAVTHANQGWTLLERGEHQQAMEHFREALRLDPEMDWARQGIVEALRSRYFLYRLMLNYFLWMSKLSRGAQWAVIIGAVVGHRVLRSIARQNEALAPYVTPLIVLYVAFVVLTWISHPLFNLLLRLNRFGRLALSREEIVTSNWVGLAVVAALLLLIASFALPEPSLVLAALGCALTVPPLSAIYHCDQGWPRTTLTLITVAIGGLTAFGAALVLCDSFLLGGDSLAALAGRLMMLGAVIGGVISQFAANALVSVTVRH